MTPTAPAATSATTTTVTKLTVNLTPRAATALEEAAGINGETKTNAVNRAIQAYAFLTRMMADGWDLVLRDPKEAREQRVQFL